MFFPGQPGGVGESRQRGTRGAPVTRPSDWAAESEQGKMQIAPTTHKSLAHHQKDFP
jgi:hypothetical protein